MWGANVGTRHLTVVVSGGTHRVAQYGQWDGYPGGQGMTVLNFCRAYLGTTKLRAAYARKLAKWVSFLDDQELERRYAQRGGSPNAPIHPELSRDTGALILVQARTTRVPLGLQDNIDFAKDSLYCEWAYVVDLDLEVLEVYRGFNRTALGPEDPPGAWCRPTRYQRRRHARRRVPADPHTRLLEPRRPAPAGRAPGPRGRGEHVTPAEAAQLGAGILGSFLAWEETLPPGVRRMFGGDRVLLLCATLLVPHVRVRLPLPPTGYMLGCSPRAGTVSMPALPHVELTSRWTGSMRGTGRTRYRRSFGPRPPSRSCSGWRS